MRCSVSDGVCVGSMEIFVLTSENCPLRPPGALCRALSLAPVSNTCFTRVKEINSLTNTLCFTTKMYCLSRAPVFNYPDDVPLGCRRVDCLVEADVPQKRVVCIFCPEDGVRTILRNGGFYQPFHTATELKIRPLESSPLWKHQISLLLTTSPSFFITSNHVHSFFLSYKCRRRETALNTLLLLRDHPSSTSQIKALTWYPASDNVLLGQGCHTQRGAVTAGETEQFGDKPAPASLFHYTYHLIIMNRTWVSAVEVHPSAPYAVLLYFLSYSLHGLLLNSGA
jgi:hypothetical protein